MPSRLTKHLVWTPVSKRAPAGYAPTAMTLMQEPSTETLSLDIAMSAHEQTIYLLHVGAEIEQLLMVQYLYAAFSLGGSHLTEAQQCLARHWRTVIAEIAREEMGHLATVENLLTLIGGALSFEREDYPAPANLYPFPFELEPLTKKSLGKYVLAEMPSEEVVQKLGLTNEINEIKKYVGDVMSGDPNAVHRVGLVYQAIQKLFQAPETPQEPPKTPPAFIHSDDISAASLRFQVRPTEWGLGQADVLVLSSVDRPSAITAIQAISIQGEGSTVKDLPTSHFGRFLEIYRNFPDEKDWKPARNVASNPTTDDDVSHDRQITNKIAVIWAELVNLRYRMALMFLSHSFHMEAPLDVSARSPRGLLITWTFGEMYNLRSISDILMDLPLHEKDDGLRAGPPFTMPYSFSLSAHEPGRWRQHRDLIQASQKYIADLQAAGAGHEKYLQGLATADQDALTQITAILGGF